MTKKKKKKKFLRGFGFAHCKNYSECYLHTKKKSNFPQAKMEKEEERIQPSQAKIIAFRKNKKKQKNTTGVFSTYMIFFSGNVPEELYA